jgi:hypothetical protein
MIVRSYRSVFRVDRRIYRVDRWALPVPGGVPLRGLGYFALALLAVVVLGRVPGVGAVSPPVRYVIVPLAAAVFGTQAAPDGRVAHRFAADWLRLRLRPRRRSAGRRVPLEGERVPWTGDGGHGVGRARAESAPGARVGAGARDVQPGGEPGRRARRAAAGERRGRRRGG